MDPFHGIRLENPPLSHICYINACINTLLNCESIRDLIWKDDTDQILKMLKEFLRTPNELHSAEDLRRFVGSTELTFNNKNMQDAVEFLEALISLEMCAPLHELFKFKLETKWECGSCNYVSSKQESWTQLRMYNKKGDSVEALITANLNDVTVIKKRCGNQNCFSNKLRDGCMHKRTESIVQGKPSKCVRASPLKIENCKKTTGLLVKSKCN